MKRTSILIAVAVALFAAPTLVFAQDAGDGSSGDGGDAGTTTETSGTPADAPTLTLRVQPGTVGGSIIAQWSQSDDAVHYEHWLGYRKVGETDTTWSEAEVLGGQLFLDLDEDATYQFRAAAIHIVNGSLLLSRWVEVTPPHRQDIPSLPPWRVARAITGPGIHAELVGSAVGRAVDGDATLVLHCYGDLGTSATLHWQDHNVTGPFQEQVTFERYGFGPWNETLWRGLPRFGGHDVLREGDPLELVRGLLNAPTYTVALANGFDAVFMTQGFAETLRDPRLANCAWAPLVAQ